MEKPKIWPPQRQTPYAAVIKIGRCDYVVNPYTCAKVCVREFAHQIADQKVLVFGWGGGGGFLQLATARPLDGFWRKTRQNTVPRKDVPFRGREH